MAMIQVVAERVANFHWSTQREVKTLPRLQ